MYARFGVDYSRSTGPNNLVYSFGANYDNTGSYTIDACFYAITSLLKETELITISNRYYYDRSTLFLIYFLFLFRHFYVFISSEL
jgi:hypothetical protein